MERCTRTRSERPGLQIGALLGLTAAVILQGRSTLFAQPNFWERTSLTLTSTVLSLASSPRGYVFAGTDNRKILRSSDGGASWTDVGTAQLSPIIWSVAVDSQGTVFAGTDFRGVFRSTDDGSSWIASNLTTQRISCLLLTKQGKAFAGVWDEGIYRSTDGGAMWTLVGASGHKVRSIIETPDGVLVAATDTTAQEGRLYRSTNGGEAWTKIGLGLSSGVVHSLVSVSAETLFAGTAGQGIYRSTNTGDYWSSSYLFLPTTVSCLVAVGDKGVFAGLLEGGVILTTDTGNSWFFEESGLPNLEVHSLMLGLDGRLYAGTGEGLCRSATVLTGISTNANAIGPPGLDLHAHPNPFNTETMLSYDVPETGPVRLDVFDLRGRRISLIERSLHPAGSYFVRWVADNLASGVYLIVLETPAGRAATKVLLLK
jgi:hypothetical protein